eukprot:TRINITY_DN8846_c0_g6_i1.p1 TRINITY_DN8846_c0_g6~~TRINITY_DN8846_c0_g6_i1.p1  ORF type:complete len:433 (-),score=28.70 TRINITY_DN8846_c0_g6_i1:263-1528(-)
MARDIEGEVEDLLALAAQSSGWSHVSSPSSTKCEIKHLDGATACLKIECAIDAAFEYIEALNRPEAAPFWPEYMSDVEESRIVDRFAPGDVTLSLRYRCMFLRTLTDLLSPFKSTSHAFAGFGTETYRVVRRRDYPEAGTISQAYLSLSSASTHYMEVVSPIPGGEKCVMRAYITFSLSYRWFLNLFISRICNKMSSFGLEIAGHKGRETHESILRRAGFFAVRVRKCHRGPPMLAISASEAERLPKDKYVHVKNLYWKPFEGDDKFCLPSYLSSALAFLGWDEDRDGAIYDSLDGRPLAFFQAAVRREAWPSMWAVLETFLLEQKVAYRYWYGGAHSPQFQADVEPVYAGERFLPVKLAASASIDHNSLEECAERWQGVCKNTFIHIAGSESIDELVRFRFEGVRACHVVSSMIHVGPVC